MEKLFWSLILIAWLPGCNPDANPNEGQKDSLAIREEFANSPVRSPEEALKTMQLEAGLYYSTRSCGTVGKHTSGTHI